MLRTPHAGAAESLCAKRRPSFCVESLEARRLLALHIENFSDDLDPTRPGFDSWDADPNTVSPDEFLIPHEVSSARVKSGLSNVNNTHSLTIPGSAAGGYYLINFAGSRVDPGGLGNDAEVAAVAPTLSLVGLRPQRVLVSDMNGDGRADLYARFRVVPADLHALAKRVLAAATRPADGAPDASVPTILRVLVTLEGSSGDGRKFTGNGSILFLLTGPLRRELLTEMKGGRLI
jgi:hypothetical protein